jgi:hypothetical protein
MATLNLPWTAEAHPGRRGGTPWLAQITAGQPFTFIPGAHDAANRWTAWTDLAPGYYTAGNVAHAPDGRMWLRVDSEGINEKWLGAARPLSFPTPGSTGRGRGRKRVAPPTPAPAPSPRHADTLRAILAEARSSLAAAMEAIDTAPVPVAVASVVTTHLDAMGDTIERLRAELDRPHP